MVAENSVIHLAHPYMLLCLGIVPAFMAAFDWSDRKRRSAHERFASSLQSRLDPSRRRWKRICVLAATVSLTIALSRPIRTAASAGPEGDTGDIVFLLDVSRSMLSADASPTRLAQAKSIIVDLTRKLHGERTALVTFAGVASVQCPLTIDRAFFQAMLDRASPESATRGGTRIGDGIQFSLESVFDDVARTRKELVILTDGGDQDSFPTIAARSVPGRGIKLVVIGVGDETNGALVPTSESDRTPILYHGEAVRTKLEQGLLQTVAATGAGMYFNATDSKFDTSKVYRQFIASPRLPSEDGAVSSWLVLFAVALLTVEVLISDRRARAAVLSVVLIVDLSAQTPAEWVAKGNIAFRASLWSQAMDSYEMAARSAPVSPETYFNMGAALYRMQRYASASDAFGRSAVASRGTPLEAASKLGQANCAYREAMDGPPRQTTKLLRLVLIKYEELSGMPDAKFNADVVKRRLADLQRRQSNDASATPSPNKRASGPLDIVQQGRVPEKTRPQSVDKDW